METVDASAVIVGVSLATLLMIIRVQSVLQDVLKAAIELASAKPATAAAETQTGVQVQDIWPGPATHNRVRQRNERAPDARYTVEAIYAMDCLWDQLSADEKTAAAVLGYDQDGWDKKIPTNVSMTPWDELGVQCQHAVDFLGYSPDLWDAEAAVAVDAEAAVAARRFQEIGGTGFGRFPEPRRAQAQVGTPHAEQVRLDACEAVEVVTDAVSSGDHPARVEQRGAADVVEARDVVHLPQ